MLCPCCQVRLTEERNANVVRTVCPSCGGLWLGREEVKKLLHLIQESERRWKDDHWRHAPHPRSYEDDDHYYLRYAHLTAYHRQQVLAEIFDL